MGQPPFSERMGFVPPRTIQSDSMDGALRHSIWNLVAELIDHVPSRPDMPLWRDLARSAAVLLLKVAIDGVPNDTYRARAWLRERYYALDWSRAYDFLEFFIGREGADSLQRRGWRPDEMIGTANLVLQRELSAFRFVSGQLTRLTSKEEIGAIEEAAAAAARAGLPTVEAHSNGALQLLGRRPDPDCLNSMKESISAVESAVNLIAGTSGGGVAKALDVLGQKVEIHGALKSALLGLYGYASSEDGIRHAMLEQSTVGYDEAKFMLVACSAFVYFLISKAAAAGLLRA